MDPLLPVLIVLVVLVLGAVVLLGLEFLQLSCELITERVSSSSAVQTPGTDEPGFLPSPRLAGYRR